MSDTFSNSAPSTYDRLVSEYHESVIRCQASLDQLRAAHRELREVATELGRPCPDAHEIAEELTLRRVDGKGAIDTSQLSDREFEVFALMGKGLSSREIAEQLHVAISTVETYRERLKSKLNLSSATALIRAATIWALSQRLSKPDGAPHETA
jgi:DNA-binding NarL/FixJ family response regulator